MSAEFTPKDINPTELGLDNELDHDSNFQHKVDPAFARLVEADRHETVYPDGIATKVPGDMCRCPIIDVGDFCPVHGG